MLLLLALEVHVKVEHQTVNDTVQEELPKFAPWIVSDEPLTDPVAVVDMVALSTAMPVTEGAAVLMVTELPDVETPLHVTETTTPEMGALKGEALGVVHIMVVSETTMLLLHE